MYYYEVLLGVERHWKSAVFTYESSEKIPIYCLVCVPFGPKKKVGIVLRETSKPSFKLKSVVEITSHILSPQQRNFAMWYQKYYVITQAEVFAQLLPQSIPKRPKQSKEELLHSVDKNNQSSLQPKQQQVVDTIAEGSKKTFVLHGITGSGKTRIYIELITAQLKLGKSSLLLLPEISLTSQIVQELQKYFSIIVYHSQLTQAQKNIAWFKIANSNEPCIVVGARSALFLPHKNLGTIIIDEAHEAAYKQESGVHYNAVYVAGGLAAVHKSQLIIGSGTPPITETEHVLGKNGQLVCLHEKALSIENMAKKVTVVDSKKRDSFVKHNLLSDELLVGVSDALARKHQSLIFINRRGTAKLVLCSSDTCDWQAECANCDLPLTYHHDSHSLLCHTCSHRESMSTTCPVCEKPTRLRSFGSKAIVEDIQKIFPHATVGRYDSDNLKAASFNVTYDEIKSGSVDILVGTQQIIKGIDLPKLSTIGIIDADMSLNFPDYSSDERTFQLITQAMGRVGRGHLNNSSVILQTHQPNNKIIQLSLSGDWHAFRDQELINRKLHNFPPYFFYAKLLFRAKTSEQAKRAAIKSCADIRSSKNEVVIEGPMPSFHAKRGGQYYYQVNLRAASRKNLQDTLNNIDESTIIDLDPNTLL